MWHAVPDSLLDFKPHEKTNSIRTILVHQILSERRFFAQFVGTVEPSVEELLPAGTSPATQAYIEKYVWLAKNRLPQLATGAAAWWLEPAVNSNRVCASLYWTRVCGGRDAGRLPCRLAGLSTDCEAV